MFYAKEQYEVVGESSDRIELFSQLKKLSVDVVIIDPFHQKNFLISDLTLINTISPGTKILVITDTDSKEAIQQIVNYGVKGFLTKTCDSTEIFDSIKSILKNEPLFCFKIVDILLGKTSQDEANCDATILSEREIEIVRLIANGYTTKEIADTLYRSFHTISTHRKNIMKKLKIKSSSELLIYAMQKGLIRPIASIATFLN